jgi:thiol-disulfide isomerase/thioredoxin
MRAARLFAALAVAAPALLGAAPRALELTGPQGEPVALALAPGEAALVVHFWATWCADCKTELPALGRAAGACEGRPVRVVVVNVAESAEEIRAFEAKTAISLPSLRDPEGRVWRRFARGLPANLVWTPAEQRSDVGPLDEAAWRLRLAALGCSSGSRSEPG